MFDAIGCVDRVESDGIKVVGELEGVVDVEGREDSFKVALFVLDGI